jgi:hypothetical protein
MPETLKMRGSSLETLVARFLSAQAIYLLWEVYNIVKIRTR